MVAEHTGVGSPDAGDAQRIDQAGQGGLPGPLHTLLQAVVGLLAETLHLHDGVPVVVQVVDIGKLVDKALRDELLQGHLREPLDVHGTAAGEKGEGLDLFGGTFRIGADQDLRVDLAPDLGLSAADRTLSGNLQGAGPGQVLRNLGNDHIGLVDGQPVPDPQLQGAHDADIVDRGPADCRPLELDGREDGDRIDEAGSAGAPLDLQQGRLLLLIRPFEGDGISGKFCRPAQRFAVGDVVEQEDQAVGRRVETRDLLFKAGHFLLDRFTGHHSCLDRLEALRLQEFKLGEAGIVKIRVAAGITDGRIRIGAGRCCGLIQCISFI